MEVLHETEEPPPFVSTRLLEAVQGGSFTIIRIRNSILEHTGVGKLSLVFSEPVCRERSVGQKEESHDGHNRSYRSLDNEKPLNNQRMPFSRIIRQHTIASQQYQKGRPFQQRSRQRSSPRSL